MASQSSDSRPRKLRIVCVSDTHNHAPGEGYTLPKGDILLHAGDLTNQGSISEVTKAVSWLEKADFAAKIVVAGNHDLSLDKSYAPTYDSGWRVVPENVDVCRHLMRHARGVTYLEHASCEVTVKDISLQVFGSPYSPDRGLQNWAFQYKEEDAERLWADVPENVDILVTHTPPAGHLDHSSHWTSGGCLTLRSTIERVRPALSVFGHCHEGRGAQLIKWDTTAICREGRAVDWVDPGRNNKKQSLLDLTGQYGWSETPCTLGGRESTALVNASIAKGSRPVGGATGYNKPIVVDFQVPHDVSESKGMDESHMNPSEAARSVGTS